MITLIQSGEAVASIGNEMKWRSDDEEFSGMLDSITESLMEDIGPAHGNPPHVISKLMADILGVTTIKDRLPLPEAEPGVMY